MSHFAVNLIIPIKIWELGNDEIKSFIESQMEMFDEQKETPRYRQYTKAELIEKEREEIKGYEKGTYAEYKKNPKKYKAECSNEKHINYVSKEFPLRLKWTDEEVYTHAIRYYEPEDIGKDGEVYANHNPHGKWDWYRIGGRWAGWLTNREKELETDNGFNFNTPQEIKDNSCTTKEAIEKDYIPFAILTPDKEWIERGQMGWWACVSNEKDDEKWNYEAKGIYQKFENDYIVCVDCHV